ncbi:MAG: hypothetical protein GY868_03535 [Deltaproteobacteria bacterium]|nr:hypothetical protein [Deltaproteobacteria bacterium]
MPDDKFSLLKETSIERLKFARLVQDARREGAAFFCNHLPVAVPALPEFDVDEQIHEIQAYLEDREHSSRSGVAPVSEVPELEQQIRDLEELMEDDDTL